MEIFIYDFKTHSQKLVNSKQQQNKQKVYAPCVLA